MAIPGHLVVAIVAAAGDLTVFLASVLVLGARRFPAHAAGHPRGDRGQEGDRPERGPPGRQHSAADSSNAADPTGDVNVDKLLIDLATGYRTSRRHEQYEVIIIARGQTITAGQRGGDSIPAALA